MLAFSPYQPNMGRSKWLTIPIHQKANNYESQYL